MFMKCVRCQKELPDGAVYCKFCGQKQDLQKEIPPFFDEGSQDEKGTTIDSVQASPAFGEPSFTANDPQIPKEKATTETQAVFAFADNALEINRTPAYPPQKNINLEQDEARSINNSSYNASSFGYSNQRKEKGPAGSKPKEADLISQQSHDGILTHAQSEAHTVIDASFPIFDLDQSPPEQDIDQQAKKSSAPPLEQKQPFAEAHAKAQPPIWSIPGNGDHPQEKDMTHDSALTNEFMAGASSKQAKGDISQTHKEYRKPILLAVSWRIVLIILEIEAIIYLYMRLF